MRGMSVRAALPYVALTVAVVGVFAPATGFGFVQVDDPAYVTENPHVLAGPTRDGIVWALTATETGNWHPLTWLSLMLDARAGGGGPRAFHVTSVLLHLANALLLFHLLARVTGAAGRSLLVAALFAVHPLHVESVAWVSERKDVLCALFGLLAILAYGRYVRRRTAGAYACVAAALALSLASKPMLVTLPFVLLLLDVWPFRRLDLGRDEWAQARRLVVEKIPLFALSATSSAIAIVAQASSGAVSALDTLPLGLRAANAAVAAVAYLAKTAWPAALAFPYPYDPARLDGPRLALSCLVLAGATMGSIVAARRRPYLAVGWLLYLVTLVPVIGIVQVGSQSMADRYTYLPLVGIFLAVAWGSGDLLDRWSHDGSVRRAVATVLAVLVVAGLGVRARAQVGVWRDTETLFTNALRSTGPNAVAEGGLGLALHGRGRLEDAIEHHRNAVRIRPGYVEARVNLAAALLDAGRLDEAARLCEETIAMRPGDARGHACLGVARLRLGRLEDAEQHLSDAIRLDPRNASARVNRALALSLRGRDDDALDELGLAGRLKPRDAGIRVTAGSILVQRGSLDAAAERFLEALRLDPSSLPALRGLGVLRARQGRLGDAVRFFEEALRLDPADEGTRRNLERARSLR